MIRRENERLTAIKEKLKDGEGKAYFKYILNDGDAYNKIKMFSTITLKKGDSIGYHTHHNEQEIMLINKGKGLYKDDDKECEVYPGDVTICEQEHFHSITNKEDDDLQIIALIITE